MNSTADATTAGSSAPSVRRTRRAADRVVEARDLGHPADVLARRDAFAGLDDETVLERHDDLVEVVEVDAPRRTSRTAPS